MLLLSREHCVQSDKNDPLASFRDEFSLPDGMVYMCGNSLGAMPKKAAAIAQQTIVEEWGNSLVKSWNTHQWFTLTTRLGGLIAQTIGAEQNEVVMTDSTSINVFKVLTAALSLKPKRKKILMEGSNFPTDNYIAQGILQLKDYYEIVFVEEDKLLQNIDESVAVVCLTHVHYKTGRVLDMHKITQLCHDKGAVVVWDLCHSAGAMPVNLNGCKADFAVGCTYKYYNGGPGSPAFIFAASRHHGKALQPLTGWWGHAAPFAFERDYRPAESIVQMQTGTQPIISLKVAEAGLEMMARADMQQIRTKSLALGDLFLKLLHQYCTGFDFEVMSPMDLRRGSQIALRHPQGYAIMQALIDAGVVGDFRAPDVLRFGFTPLYLRYVDVWDAVMQLRDIMTEGRWQHPRYQQRHAVT
jgi:kynureninase